MQKKSRSVKEPKTDLQAFHDKIKEKLYDWKNALEKEHSLSIDFNTLADVINKRYKIDTSAQILASMFAHPQTGNTRKIPLAEMLAVCQELKIPILDFCVLPSNNIVEDTTKETFVPWLKKTDGVQNEKTGVYAMLDPHYMGTYYAYRFQTKKRTPLGLEGKNPADGLPLQEYRLTFEQVGGASYVTMENVDTTDSVVLKGCVFLLNRSRQIYARLVDSDGLRVVNMQFSYRQYSVERMNYRTAAILSTAYNQLEAPLFCKMAIFKERQNLNDEAVQNMIRGILTLDSRDILVDKKAFAELVKQDESYAILKPQLKQYYVLQESDFANPELPWEFEDRIKRLLQLRRVSELSAQELVQDSEDIASFFKKIQKNQETD